MNDDDERQARLAAIRARHVLDDFGMVNPATGKYEKRNSCKGCHRPWPCEQSVLLAEVDAATARAERAERLGDSPTWPYVLAFARQMEAKLDANRHKGNREGWLKDAPIDLLARLVEEVVELQHAIGRGYPSKDIAEEAADVANFALMAADAYQHRYAARAALAEQGEG